MAKKRGKTNANGQNDQVDNLPAVTGQDAGTSPANDESAPAKADAAAPQADAGDQDQDVKALPAVIENTPSTDSAPAAHNTLDLAGYEENATARRLSKLRGFARKSFNVASNMTGRMAVTSTLKIAAGSFVVGAGLSAAWGAAIAVGVAAIGSAAYTYTAETYSEWRARKKAGEDVTFFNVLRHSNNSQQRMRRTLTSLACGVAFGALGAWAMQSEFVHGALEKVGGLFGFGGADHVATAVPHADGGAATVLADSEATRAAATAAAVAHHTGAAAGATIDVDIPAAHVDASAAHVAPAHVSGADLAHEAAHVTSQQVAENPLAAGLAQAGIADSHAVSAQALKDAAHNIIRDQSISAAERVEMARALALEAAHRGNEQAATFLADLPKVEVSLGLQPTHIDIPEVHHAAAHVAPHATAPAAPVASADVAPAPAAPVVDAAPVADVAPAATVDTTAAATMTADTTVTATTTATASAADGTTAAVSATTTTGSASPAGDFRAAAAWCNVSFNGSVVSGAECYAMQPTMGGNDYVLFVDAADANRQVAISLAADSVTVSTDSMLQEGVVNEGISSLQAAPRVTVTFRR